MGKEFLLAFILFFAVASALAQNPAAERIRGTITGVGGNELQVKTRAGLELKVNIDDQTVVSVLSALKISDIKVGSFVGVTALSHGPGTPLSALEVHIFPENMRGTGEGHRNWDLQPGSTMTNANVDAIVDTNDGKKLTLSYKGGKQHIVVNSSVPIVTFHPGDKSLLKTGAQVFIIAERTPDGILTAKRIQVGQNGLQPPM